MRAGADDQQHNLSVVYAPASAGQKSASQSFFVDGLNRVSVGTRGTLKLTLQGGKLPMWQFSFTGLWADATDANPPSGVAAQLESFVNAVEFDTANTTTFTLGGIATVVDKFELELGNVVIFRDRPNAAYVAFTDRKAKGSITFEQTTVATEDWQAAVAASTTLALSITHGTVAGNKLLIAANKVQLGEPSDTDLQGILGVTFPLNFVRTAGDDELSITFE